MQVERSLSSWFPLIPECIAAGYVDLAAHTLLAVKTADPQPVQALDEVARATAALFEGPAVRAVAEAYRRAQGAPDGVCTFLGELLVCGEEFLYVFVKSRRRADHALLFVCRSSANIGLVLRKTRRSAEEIEHVA